MIFTNLLGLLGLLGIVALIIIYILKPKYQDQLVSSTFVWKLSLKYKKKKMPFEWLKSSLILILQVAILLVMTAILIKPHLVFATDSGEKIVILDTSASMLADLNGKTRLERAISEIDNLAKTTISEEDRFTLITTGETAEMLINRTDSYEYVRNRLSTVKSHYSTSNIDEAMLLTESILKINPSTEIIYYTSNDFEDTGNVRIRNMSKGEWNVAVLNFTGKLDVSLNYIFSVELVSYGRDIKDLVLNLKIDGERKSSTAVNLEAGVVLKYDWKIQGLNENNFEIAEISLAEINDDFIYDNNLMFYSNHQRFKVQIVGNDTETELDSTKEYITSALRSQNRKYDVTSYSKLEDAEIEGFDLYIYSVNVPEVLPEDGAIWIFDPEDVPSELGLSIGNDVAINNGKLSGNNSGSETYQKIMQLIRPDEITVSRYKDFSMYSGFEILMNYEGDPVLLTKNLGDVKVTVFGFSLSYSNLPILFFDFPILIRNLSEYSVISTIEKAVNDAGETINLHAKPSTTSMIVTHNGESKIYDNFPVKIDLHKIGKYDITHIFKNGESRTESFYVRIPEIESRFDYIGDTILMPVIPDPDVTVSKKGLKNLLPYLAAALLILIVVEWGVQYREQY